MFADGVLRRGDLGVSTCRLFDLVALGQDHLVGYGRPVEQFQHVEIDVFQAVTAVDQHENAPKVARPRRKSSISEVQLAIFSLDTAA